MALKTTKKTVEVAQVPSVAMFVTVQAQMQAFLDNHKEVFDTYASLAETYNSALEAADKDLRAMCVDTSAGVSCGPFNFKHFATKYNGDNLLAELENDDEEFQKLAGIIRTVRTNEIDKPMMDSLIERGAVHPDLQRRFVTRTPNYDKPKKLGIP